jgi:acetyl-CoA carboxylase/biotin carboxylase 1
MTTLGPGLGLGISHKTFPSVTAFVTELGGTLARPISKILIANNGIGAVKCIRSIRKWSYDTFGDEHAVTFVVMATPEDLKSNAEFIRMADEIVDVPGGSNNNNYANVKLIVEIARFRRVDAVWAGWGHASENPALPNSLHALNIKFIGPAGPPMHALGDKIGSTIIAQTAGMPCIAWNGSEVLASYNKDTGSLPAEAYDSAMVKTPEQAQACAAKIGFPIMIKASEGGGGKGIRKVSALADVPTAYRQVVGEVPGSPIFIMKMSSQSRHLEVQLIADEYGDAIALNGRDCSVQRRHQKIIEEGPPVAADANVWPDMEAAAVQLAKAVNYTNAGTVEYLYSEPDKKFYFLELNPRLQVEHPVTEMITRVNLPATQLQVAMGIPLKHIADIRTLYGYNRYELPGTDTYINFETENKGGAKRVPPNGHCIAVRITAENAEAGFKPTSGGIQELNFRSTPDVWGYFSMDSSGSVHEFADSQFGHLFANGIDREQARKNMVLALKELSIRGDISTTVDYISQLIELEDFKKNNIDTGWLDELISLGSLQDITNVSDLKSTKKKLNPHLLVSLASTIVAFQQSTNDEAFFAESLEKGQIPPASLLEPVRKTELIYDSIKYKMTCVRSGVNSFAVSTTGSSSPHYVSTVIRSLSDGGFLCSLDGRSHVVYVTAPLDSPSGLRLSLAGQNVNFTPDYDPTNLSTDVAGKLVKQLVPDGAHLNKGDAYAEIEVMKMFLPLKVEESGTITWASNEGAALAAGQSLAKLALDNPGAVKTAVVFTGDLEPVLAADASAPAPLEAKRPRAHVLLGDAVASLSRVMSGFIIPSDNLETALVNLADSVVDPTLGVYEIDDQLSVLSGRLDPKLFHFITGLIEDFKIEVAKANNKPTKPFAAHAVIKRMEEHALSISDAGERAAFIALTTPLRETALPYARQSEKSQLISGSERVLIALLQLLRDFIEVESNFCDNVAYADAVDSLRRAHTTDLGYVMKICRAHAQLQETSKLCSLLIEIIGGAAITAKQAMTGPDSNGPPSPTRGRASVVDGAHSLFAAIPCLSEIGKMGGSTTHSSLAAKARKLLLQETIPSAEQRMRRINALLIKATGMPAEEKLQTIRTFVRNENMPMMDVFLEMLPKQASTDSKSVLLRIYTEKVYRPYVVSNFQFDSSKKACSWTFAVKADASPTITRASKVDSVGELTQLLSRTSSSPPPPPNPKSLDRERTVFVGNESDSEGFGKSSRVPAGTDRFGVFLELASIDQLKDPNFLESALNLFPQYTKAKPRSLSGPTNALHLALPDPQFTQSEDEISSLLSSLLTPFLESVRKADIRRVTFLLGKPNRIPSIFTFRARFDFAEDTAFRHIEPSLAYNLELGRIAKNFKVVPLNAIQSNAGANVHIYHSTPKQSALLKDTKASKAPRMFVRSLVLLPDLTTAAYERVFVESLNSLDASANGIVKDNHLFINLLSDESAILDATIVEQIVTTIMNRHQKRLARLGVEEVETKVTARWSADSEPVSIRLVASNPTGLVLLVSIYAEVAEEGSEGQVIFKAIEEQSKLSKTRLTAGSDTLSGQSVDTPYPLTRPFTLQRRMAANMSDTIYVYDIPSLYDSAVELLWANYNEKKSAGGYPINKPLVCTTVSELVIKRRGARKNSGDAAAKWTMNDYLDGNLEMIEEQREAGQNDVGMVAWMVTLKTPEFPAGRQFVLISNDITKSAGSFGTREDIVFKMASEFARKKRVPRLYCAANSGARIGMAEGVKKCFKVSFKDESRPESGFKHLYLDKKDHDLLKSQGAVICEVEADPSKFKITDVIGTEEDLGVENLKGSGLIAGETSLAYNDIFTLTVVLGRTVGIGAYLVRLGQRTIQKKGSSPIILTGYQALNKLMGTEVYSTNDQLGGPQIMHPNGVSHLLANTHFDAVFQALEWLSFVPDVRGGKLPVADIRGIDTTLRKIEFTPQAGATYDPRLLLNGGYVNNEWHSGFFDKNSFVETLAGWAKTVVVGRARLGGIPMGVIVTENRTTEAVIPADPADKKSSESIVQQAGGVWFPDSAYKTAQAIRDFNGEDLPIMVFANWRGFSGGQRDMFDEVLKFGSQIVDALVSCTQPVFVYIPPHAELRGGAWVVVDATINAEVMEFYAADGARGGVLEANGAASIKFRHKDLIKTMHRLDKVLKGLDAKLSERLDDSERTSVTREISDRESLLLPVYDQIAVHFADLHDTPGRMKERGVIRDCIAWEDSRVYFYGRVQRRLAEFSLRNKMCAASNIDQESALTPTGASKLLERWFKSAGMKEEAWADDKIVVQWLSENVIEIDKRLDKLKMESVARSVKRLSGESSMGLLQGLKGVMDGMSSSDREEFARDLAILLEL